MNKMELVAAMAESTGMSKKDCGIALDAFTAAVENTLRTDGKVQLVGFGSFEVKCRAERNVRSPKTKETILVPASRTPVFKPGKALKEAIR